MYQIQVKNLSKKYKVYNSALNRLRDWIIQEEDFHEEFWALKNIDFTVEPGESIGFIGHNGAGKSTLLKLLTGTVKPTEGTIEINGRVAALLELGMGFHPDFTGIQNIYMSGQLMGLRNSEITELIPKIEEFAEIGHHIHQPLRTYSSGMSVRLGFSIATAVRPDILIVDEALSVGDAYFQHKSFKRIREFREQGTTLLFVSHDPGAVKNLCDRAILLEKGKQIMDGKPEDVLDYYNAIIAVNEADFEIKQTQGEGDKKETRSGNNKAVINKVYFTKDNIEVNAIQVMDEITLNIDIEYKEKLINPTIGFIIKDRLGNEIYGTNTFHLKEDLGECLKGSKKTVQFSFPANFGTGSYSISVAIHNSQTHLEGNYNWWDNAATIKVLPGNHPYFIGLNYIPVKLNNQ